MKRILCTALSMCMVFLVIAPTNQGKENHIKEDFNDLSSTYIIQCDNSIQYQELKNEFTEENQIVVNHKSSDEKYLEDSKSMVVNLKEEEAKDYKEKYDIQVESDEKLIACTNENKCIPVQIPDKYYDKSVEYSDNPKDFKPCKYVTDKNKMNEEVSWNISCISKKPYKNKYKGKNIKVAVIDSGIDTHDDLNTKEWIDFSDKVNGYKPIDSSGHGTNISGIIAARQNGIGVLGIASEAELYSVKILNEDNTTNVSNVIKALEWCIDNDIDVINMSFGMNEYSSILSEVIDRAYKKGIVMIGSAGNNTDTIQYPAAYDSVISVGSINKDLQPSSFSKNNNKVDLVAPGEDVHTLDYLGGYCTANGTSVAAAHVTGVAAAILSTKKAISINELKNTLISSSAILDDGSRLVSYDNAIEKIKNNKVPRESLCTIKRNINDSVADSSNDVLEASWSTNKWLSKSFDNGSGHKSMINKISIDYFGNGSENSTQKKHNRDIVADAIARTDDLEWLSASHEYGSAGRNEYGRLDLSKPACISPYHAKSEYDFGEINSHSLFLYEMARRGLILNENSILDSTKYVGSNFYNVYIPQLMMRRIIVDLSAVYDQQCIVFGNNYCKNVTRHKGYMILGVFLHLIQDIQAHRAKCTSNMIFANPDGTSYYVDDRFNPKATDSIINGRNIIGVLGGDYSTYWRLHDAIIQHGGSIPMIRLKDFLQNPCRISYENITCSSSAAYEDNPVFYSDRYSAAYTITYAYIDRMNNDAGNFSNSLGSYLCSNDVSLFMDKY